MTKYKSYRIIDGKPQWIIADETGKIININPNKDELKGLEKEIHKSKYNKPYYNRTDTCDRCNEENIETKLNIGNAHKEYSNEGNWTGKWNCSKCWRKYDHNNQNNLLKSVRNVRTGNENPNSSQAKGNNNQKLACKLYEWIDLNIEYNNYETSIDCYDPKTGLYHQVRGLYYDSKRQDWSFGNFKKDWFKKYETMVCFCFSKDGKTIERIYKFPEIIVSNKSGADIYKGPVDRWRNQKFPWYEEYRVKNKNELDNANKIWKEIIGSRNNI